MALCARCGRHTEGATEFCPDCGTHAATDSAAQPLPVPTATSSADYLRPFAADSASRSSSERSVWATRQDPQPGPGQSGSDSLAAQSPSGHRPDFPALASGPHGSGGQESPAERSSPEPYTSEPHAPGPYAHDPYPLDAYEPDPYPFDAYEPDPYRPADYVLADPPQAGDPAAGWQAYPPSPADQPLWTLSDQRPIDLLAGPAPASG
jgi:hypothetical protein